MGKGKSISITVVGLVSGLFLESLPKILNTECYLELACHSR
jgi:hypothetical protein